MKSVVTICYRTKESITLHKRHHSKHISYQTRSPLSMSFTSSLGGSPPQGHVNLPPPVRSHGHVPLLRLNRATERLSGMSVSRVLQRRRRAGTAPTTASLRRRRPNERVWRRVMSNMNGTQTKIMVRAKRQSVAGMVKTVMPKTD